MRQWHNWLFIVLAAFAVYYLVQGYLDQQSELEVEERIEATKEHLPMQVSENQHIEEVALSDNKILVYWRLTLSEEDGAGAEDRKREVLGEALQSLQRSDLPRILQEEDMEAEFFYRDEQGELLFSAKVTHEDFQ